jgi:predicted kinase
MYRTKLIVLRGNSGPGKSTVAKRPVEQDNIRRGILKEKETDDRANIALISLIV